MAGAQLWTPATFVLFAMKFPSSWFYCCKNDIQCRCAGLYLEIVEIVAFVSRGLSMRAKETVGRGVGKLLHIENTMYTFVP